MALIVHLGLVMKDSVGNVNVHFMIAITPSIIKLVWLIARRINIIMHVSVLVIWVFISNHYQIMCACLADMEMNDL